MGSMYDVTSKAARCSCTGRPLTLTIDDTERRAAMQSTQPKAYQPKVCAQCAATFTPHSGRSRYCSVDCRKAVRRAVYVPRPRKPRTPLKPLADRLWARVDIGAPDECWEWQGSRRRGYGRIGVGGSDGGMIDTHRAAWTVTRGPIPDGLVVRHRCDNPPCCNPAHLALGTRAQNSQDARERGRTAREFRNSRCRLSDEQVRDIRAAYDPTAHPMTGPFAAGWMRSNARELAGQYGVHEDHIRRIVRGQRRDGVA